MKKSISICFLTILTPLFIQAQIVDKKSIVAKKAKVEKVADGFSFTEGPAVHYIGDVYFTDQPNNKIMKWSATRNEVSVFMEDSGRSNGMYFDRNRNLITCADMENQVWSIDDKGKVDVIIESFQGKKIKWSK
jgi:gluconolactonase